MTMESTLSARLRRGGPILGWLVGGAAALTGITFLVGDIEREDLLSSFVSIASVLAGLLIGLWLVAFMLRRGVLMLCAGILLLAMGLAAGGLAWLYDPLDTGQRVMFAAVLLPVFGGFGAAMLVTYIRSKSSL